MKSRSALWGMCLAPFAAAQVFGEKMVSGHDPANFAMAIRHGFNVFAERPHAPGYPHFVLLWNTLHSILPLSEHGVILFINALWMSIAVAATYQLAKKCVGNEAALSAALLTLTNPVLLYYACVGEIYSYDAAFGALAVLAVYCDSTKRNAWYWMAIGFAGGFRLSSVILLLPVLLFAQWSRREQGLFSAKSLVRAAAAFLLGTLLWVIPYTFVVGGFTSLGSIVLDAGDLEGTIAQHFSIYIVVVLWMLNAGLVFFLRRHRNIDPRTFRLLWLWIALPTLFFVLRFYAKGYALLFLPAVILLIVSSFAHKRNAGLIAGILATINIILFVFTPFITPSVESSLPHSMRSGKERLVSAALRGTSYYAPTLSHIRVGDRSMDDALMLVSQTPAGATIVVDPSAGLWAYPRSLQWYFPERAFVLFNGRDSTVVSEFRGKNVFRLFPMDSAMASPNLFYLTDPQFSARIGLPPSVTLLGEREHLALFRVGSERRAFRQRMIELTINKNSRT